jgi:hypothetical protein
MIAAMAQPLGSGKKAVDLAGGARKLGSRIRRAPPPKPEKKLSAAELREREAWLIGTGMLAFGIALAVILFAIGRWAGWSPADYTILIRDR